MTAEPAQIDDDLLLRATPPEFAAHMVKVALKVISRANIGREVTRKPRILEPSAGGGSITRAVREAEAAVLCVDSDPQTAHQLNYAGYPCICADFLALKPVKMLFDAVVMNPPPRDEVAHVMHALNFVRPGGPLVAVMSPAWKARQPRFRTFSEMIYTMNAELHEIPNGTFRHAGRNLATILVVFTR